MLRTNSTKAFDRVRKFLNVFAFGLILFIGAAAGHSGYFAKWGFWDESERGALAVLDGTGERPFVYRQLVPRIAIAVSHLVSVEHQKHIVNDGWMKHFSPQATYAKAKPIADYKRSFAYQLMFFISFIGLFLALLVMYRWCRDLNCSIPISLLTPLVFSLFYPIFMTRGGYWYDSFEVLFLMGAVWLAARGHWIGLLLASTLAALNKESYLFFVPTLFPLLRTSLKSRASALLTIGCGFAAGGSHFIVRYAFSENSGQGVEFHLWENLAFYLNPSSYFGQEANYGIPMPRGIAIPYIALVWLLWASAWKYLTTAMRQHALIALAVNMPLFLMFCWRDELRNLSMLYPTLISLIAISFARSNGEPHHSGSRGTIGREI